MLQRVRVVATRLVRSSNASISWASAATRQHAQHRTTAATVLRSLASVRLFSSESDKTFAGQASLPRLPIPKLEEVHTSLSLAREYRVSSSNIMIIIAMHS